MIFLLKTKQTEILSVNIHTRIHANPLDKPKAQSWHFRYFPQNLGRLLQLNSVSARAPFSFDDIAPPSHLGFQFAVAAEQVPRRAQHYLQVYSEIFFDVSQPPLCPLITVVSRQISRHPSQRLYAGSLWELLWGGNGISCFTIQEPWSGSIYHSNSEESSNSGAIVSLGCHRNSLSRSDAEVWSA